MPETALRTALAGLAVAGAVLLIVAEFTAVVEVVVGSLETVTRSVDGGDNHGYALLLVGLAALPLAWLVRGGHRAAAVGLAGLGAAALVVAFAVDLPDISGAQPESVAYQDADARAGTGLYLELLGGAALLTAGVLAWTLAEARARRARGRR